VSSRLFSGGVAGKQQKGCATFITMSTPLFSSVVAGEQWKAFTTASFHERRFFLMPESFFGSTKLHKLGKVAPL
jgi:hypothetical protein